MDYISQHDQLKHSSIARAIGMERDAIAKHHSTIKQLHERLLRIGTEDEQATKRLNMSAIIALEKLRTI